MMSYTESFETKSRLGILLPMPENIAKHFLLILDENNKLWYSDFKVVDNISEIKPFCVVFFRFDDNNKITYIWAIDNPSWYEGIKCISLYKIRSVDFSFEDYKYWEYGRYQEGGIAIVGYKKENAEDYSIKRYFIIDSKEQSFHELPKAFGEFINKRYNNIEQTFPVQANVINEIYNIVKNFNPYEVFESYKIEINYWTHSRPGKEDYYYEYKSYSIKYIDDYLEKWFKNYRITLHKDSGFTAFFERVNPYERFYNEENEAKEKAYREYNKQEHFDCLMKNHYSQILSHISEIMSDKFEYTSFEWLPEDIQIKKAYWHFNNHFTKYSDSLENSSIEFNLLKIVLEYNKESGHIEKDPAYKHMMEE